MHHLAMDPSPHAVVGGDEGLPGKPEPAIFLEVARRLGVAPARCVVFEDAPFGIEAARRAGMAAVAVCSSHAAHELAGPHVLAAIDHYSGADAADILATLTTISETHHVREGTAPLIRREDYAAPAFWIRSVELTFDLDGAKTLVASRLHIERNARVPARSRCVCTARR